MNNIKTAWDMQQEKQQMIDDIIEDLQKQSQKEMAVFYIQQKPISNMNKTAMEQVHKSSKEQILNGIKNMLSKKKYAEVQALHELIGVENE